MSNDLSGNSLWGPTSSSGRSAGLVEVSHQVLGSAGQFSAVSITAQQYRWLEILVFGWVSSAYGNVYLECNGSISGSYNRLTQENTTLAGVHYATGGSAFGFLGGVSISPDCRGTSTTKVPLLAAGPHPGQGRSAMAGAASASVYKWNEIKSYQNSDTDPITSVRALTSGTTFAAGSTMTIFGMGSS